MNPTPELFPKDIHNETLLANVHPRDWKNPDPAARYDLVVLGGGTAGLVSAAGAAGLGARVPRDAVDEERVLAGDGRDGEGHRGRRSDAHHGGLGFGIVFIKLVIISRG